MLHTLDVKTVNSSTMLLIIRSMLRMQHIKTVNSSTMLFINHTIDTSSSRWHSLSVYCNWRNRKFYYYYSKNKKPRCQRENMCDSTFSNRKMLVIYIFVSVCYGDKKIFCRSSHFLQFEMGQPVSGSRNGSTIFDPFSERVKTGNGS